MWPFKSKKTIEEARMYRETKAREDLDKMNSRSTSVLRVTTMDGHSFLFPVTTKGRYFYDYRSASGFFLVYRTSITEHSKVLQDKHKEITTKGVTLGSVLSFGPHMIASVETEGETLHWQAEEGDEGYLSELPHGH